MVSTANTASIISNISIICLTSAISTIIIVSITNTTSIISIVCLTSAISIISIASNISIIRSIQRKIKLQAHRSDSVFANTFFSVECLTHALDSFQARLLGHMAQIVAMGFNFFKWRNHFTGGKLHLS